MLYAPEREQEWLDFLCAQRVVGFFEQPIQLRSGRMSHWYVNWRTVFEDVWALQRCVSFVLDAVEAASWQPQTLFGGAEGASKWGVLAQLKWAKRQADYGPGTHALSMGRGREKSYGDPKDRHFLGTPRGTTVVIEDVTTTGDSLLNSVRTLQEMGVDVRVALCLTDRQEPRADGRALEDVLAEHGVHKVVCYAA
ncbi:MAG: hypothetical protein AAGJ35_08715 [Myxococcota bacterium]